MNYQYMITKLQTVRNLIQEANGMNKKIEKLTGEKCSFGNNEVITYLTNYYNKELKDSNIPLSFDIDMNDLDTFYIKYIEIMEYLNNNIVKSELLKNEEIMDAKSHGETFMPGDNSRPR